MPSFSKARTRQVPAVLWAIDWQHRSLPGLELLGYLALSRCRALPIMSTVIYTKLSTKWKLMEGVNTNSQTNLTESAATSGRVEEPVTELFSVKMRRFVGSSIPCPWVLESLDKNQSASGKRRSLKPLQEARQGDDQARAASSVPCGPRAPCRGLRGPPRSRWPLPGLRSRGGSAGRSGKASERRPPLAPSPT